MDLKVQVIASNITNLTDARYFAAYGVQYLLFDLSEISIMAIEEIIDWVSGPKILLDIGANHVDDIDEAVLKLKPYAIGSSDGINLSYLAGHVGLMDINRDSQGDTIFLEGHLYQAYTDSTINLSHVILKGSNEAKTGYKSFEDLDDILEALVIEY